MRLDTGQDTRGTKELRVLAYSIVDDIESNQEEEEEEEMK